MWLAEASGLRLLFDPLLAPTHLARVALESPMGLVRAEALRADFVFVSHRHPDHFDVPSLARLAALDPETVVVTPDALVAWAARQLGFSTVREVPPGQRIELDGVTIVTTPSVDPREWGAMVHADAAVVWNQVDTVHRGPADIARVAGEALRACGRTRVALALTRWQPMLEIAAALGRATGFPYRDYAAILQEVAAVDPVALVPSACGGRHTASFRWLDRHVFPVSPTRFVADVRALRPGIMALPGAIGTRLEVRDDTATVVATASPELVEVDEVASDPRAFEPLATPAMVDAPVHDEATMRSDVRAWIEGPLRAALARLSADLDLPQLRFVVSVVFAATVDAYTITAEGGTAVCDPTASSQWDALNQVAGSQLWQVINGRRHWGDVLLSGGLRARTRAYRVDPSGLRRLDVAETFLYYALSYDQSVERMVRWQVARAIEHRATP